MTKASKSCQALVLRSIQGLKKNGIKKQSISSAEHMFFFSHVWHWLPELAFFRPEHRIPHQSTTTIIFSMAFFLRLVLGMPPCLKWCPMTFYGVLWRSMVFQCSMMFYGVLWFFLLDAVPACGACEASTRLGAAGGRRTCRRRGRPAARDARRDDSVGVFNEI